MIPLDWSSLVLGIGGREIRRVHEEDDKIMAINFHILGEHDERGNGTSLLNQLKEEKCRDVIDDFKRNWVLEE